VVLLYTCETVYDNAVISMVPTVVTQREDLERAKGRLHDAQLVAESFLGPPLASTVFARRRRTPSASTRPATRSLRCCC
jgi:hypothetical protein